MKLQTFDLSLSLHIIFFFLFLLLGIEKVDDYKGASHTVASLVTIIWLSKW